MNGRRLALAGPVALAIGVALASGVALLPGPGPATLPDPRLTPGATIPGVDREDTCDPGYARRARDVPESVKVAVFRRYGIDPTPANRARFEVDHSIPLSIGGSNALANLWPEPWDGPEGAHAKDRLEYLCYLKVCRGEITVAEAQAMFRGDWRDAYRRFGLDRPRVGAAPGAATPDDDHDDEGFPIGARP